MALVVATPALAEGEEKGKITIADAGSATYSIYKIFDATSNGSDITYSIDADSDWLSTVYNTTTNESRIDGLKFTPDTASNPTKYTVTKTVGFDAAAFAKTLWKNIAEKNPVVNNPAAQGDATYAEQGNLDAGYYLVIDNDSTLNPDTDRAMLTTVLELTPGQNVTIQNKNDMPFDKTYKKNTDSKENKESAVQVGDTLTFKISGVVPNTTDYESYNYLVSDTMTEGLTFNKNLAVTIATEPNPTTITPTEVTDANQPLTGNQVRYDANGKTFELSLDLFNLGRNTAAEGEDSNSQAGKAITITYTATVNDKASAVVSENKATLNYSNDPTDSSKFGEKTSETKSYSTRVVIDKHEAGTPEQKLSGAKFVLRDTKDATASSNYYKIENGSVSWIQATSAAVPASGITEVVTGTDGSATFEGLEDGTYYLVETAAPAGYVSLTEPIEIVIDGSNSTDVALNAQQQAQILNEIVEVANTPGTALPSTGGMGTTIFYAGSMAVLAIIVMRFMRRDQEA